VKNWGWNWTRGSIKYSLKSLNHNLGFFHRRKIKSWEPGPEVLLKTKTSQYRKYPTRDVKRANIPYMRVCNKSISTPKL